MVPVEVDKDRCTMGSICKRCLRRLGDRKYVDEEFLRNNPDCIFVFGDNLERRGKGGAAMLRDEPNTYGFITKKRPMNADSAFYHPSEYREVYEAEITKLEEEVAKNPDSCYLISKVGAGLANRFGIFEKVIEPNMKQDLVSLSNVLFLW